MGQREDKGGTCNSLRKAQQFLLFPLPLQVIIKWLDAFTERQLSLAKKIWKCFKCMINVMCLRKCSCFARSCQTHKANIHLRARPQNGRDLLPRMVLELTTGPISQNNFEDRDYLMAGNIYAIFICENDAIELKSFTGYGPNLKKSCFKNFIGTIFFFFCPIHPTIHPTT